MSPMDDGDDAQMFQFAKVLHSVVIPVLAVISFLFWAAEWHVASGAMVLIIATLLAFLFGYAIYLGIVIIQMTMRQRRREYEQAKERKVW
jgi:membrane protein YdbS with pleckstrin-like domain